MLGDSGIRKLAASLLVAALAWSQGCWESSPAKPDEAVREAFDLSYLPWQIDAARESIDGAFESQRTRFTDKQLAVAKQVLQEQLAAEKLEKRILEHLAERNESRMMDETLEWLRRPRVQRIMQARIAMESPKELSELRAFVDQTSANRPSEKRVALIERYNRASHLPELVEETVLLPWYGVAIMADALQPTTERLGPEALRESMDGRRALLEPLFMEITSITSRFAFRDLSDEEVEDLVIFAESEPGRWHFETASEAFLKTLEESVADLGPAFVASLHAEPSS